MNIWKHMARLKCLGDFMRILCFGDSNTWGDVSETEARLENRWPVLVQKAFVEFTIIEEGLCGRTFNSETNQERSEGLNGFSYFVPCVNSHDPVDVLFLALGCNDSKLYYNKDGAQIYADAMTYVSFLQKEYPHIKVFFILPANIREPTKWPIFKGGNTKLNEFAELIISHNHPHIDARDLAVGEDGIHLTIESHKKLAERVCKVLLEIQ